MSEHATEHVGQAAHHAGQAVTHAGHGVKGALGRKLGPMPVGGWLLAVAGGIGVALYFRNRSAADTSSATDPADTQIGDLSDFTSNDGSGFDQADPGGTMPGVGGAPSLPPVTDTGGNPVSPGTPAETHHGAAWKARHATTNSAWLNHAVTAMSAYGFGAHAVADSLDKYLKGQRLTAGDEVRVSATLARAGNAPHPPHRIAGPGAGRHEPAPHHPVKDHGTPTGQPHHHKRRHREAIASGPATRSRD